MCVGVTISNPGSGKQEAVTRMATPDDSTGAEDGCDDQDVFAEDQIDAINIRLDAEDVLPPEADGDQCLMLSVSSDELAEKC